MKQKQILPLPETKKIKPFEFSDPRARIIIKGSKVKLLLNDTRKEKQ